MWSQMDRLDMVWVGDVENVHVFSGMEGIFHPWTFDRDCQMGRGDSEGSWVHLVILLTLAIFPLHQGFDLQDQYR